MLLKIFNRKIRDMSALFNGHYVDLRACYALTFDGIPCVSFVGEIDTVKAFTHITEMLGPIIVTIYQHAYFDHNDQQMFFNNTIFVLKNKRIIELAENCCQVLHTPKQYVWANSLIKELVSFRVVKENKVIGFATRTVMN